MIERRKIIPTIASVAGALLTGCLSWSETLTGENSNTTTETGSSPTTTETERSSTSTETRHSSTATETEQTTTRRYANEDLIVSNWSSEKRDGKVTVAPSTTEVEPFTDEFSFLPSEGNPPEKFKKVYENLEQMSVDCTVTVDVNGFDEATYEWNKDYPSDYRGLRAYIKDDGIDFEENIR